MVGFDKAGCIGKASLSQAWGGEVETWEQQDTPGRNESQSEDRNIYEVDILKCGRPLSLVLSTLRHP